MKNGGSLSLKPLLCSRTSLLDFSNQFSALLLSPELFLPLGLRLDGEPELPSALFDGTLAPLLSLEDELAPVTFRARRLRGECRSETER